MNIFNKNRSSAGCWTCRLRRKKCNEARPTCEGCAALDIECLYSDERPAWMDNGSRQRAMSDRLKRDVKDRAAWRREKRFMRDIEKGTSTITLGETTTTSAGGTHMFSITPAATPSIVGARDSPSSSTPPSDRQPSTGPASSMPDTAVSAPAASQAGSPLSFLSPPSLDQERDLNLMMVYLDYVFPFLYPFCRPSVLSSGRGWLLVLLTKNKAVFHSALSLSSFFMAVVATTRVQEQTALQDGPPDDKTEGSHSACLAAMSSELHKQQELSLREMQRAITAIQDRDCNGDCSAPSETRSTEHLADSARVLESILQLLSFECVLQRLDSWHVHLEAALSLFEQIMLENSSSGKDSWSSIMAQLSPFRQEQGSGLLHQAPVPFGSDQAALKFHVSLLLFMDIVTSTTVEQPPRLLRFHRDLIRPDNTENTNAENAQNSAQSAYNFFSPFANTQLDMHEVVGVRNWVLLALTETAALAAWKKEAAAAGRLTLSELLARAAPIEGSLRCKLASLEVKIAAESSSPSNHRQEPGFYSPYVVAAAGEMRDMATRAALAPPPQTKYRGPADSTSRSQEMSHADGAVHLSVDVSTHIWGLGVLAYLLVVINGWQPASEAIRQTADQALLELAALPSASCLRVVAWPLCVVGCLASSDQRPIFRGMVGQICGGQLLFGSVMEALRIMEGVWAAHDLQGSTADWDFGRCFSVLGRRPFLL